MRGENNQTYDDWVNSESWTRGQSVEDQFGKALRKIYPEAYASSYQNQFNHIDWICDKGTIDVKAIKKINRMGSLDGSIIWIEFKNGIGEDGWILGEQDWIAFEMKDHFKMCRTKEVRDLAYSLCDLDNLVDKAEHALYKGYSRKNRKDLLSMIKASDLSEIECQILQK